MAWNMSGQMLETCSCQQTCPCNFGPAHPDMGWCSGIIGLDIQQGSSDGVSLAGTKAILDFDLPHDFVGGNATARVWIDDRANTDQRRELEAIVLGKKGGVFAALTAVVSKRLPTQFARIEVKSGDKGSISVGNIGMIHLAKIKDEHGNQAKLENAPTTRAFAQTLELAYGHGSHWADPEMRRWVSGGAGSASPFNMKS